VDYFKAITKKDWNAATRIPTAEESITKLQQAVQSKFPLRKLGFADSGPVLLTEEDRESHIHVLGSPGEGKSKFLELLLRQDIDLGYGACLLDPSDNGDTMYKVLKYAIKNKHKKIVIIDPHDADTFNCVPAINPIHYSAPTPAVIGNFMDSVRVLWGQSSFTDTPRIQKYLPAVIATIHASGYTLAEVRWFLERDFVSRAE
jgi:DNA helicase HerA-like ATPase